MNPPTDRITVQRNGRGRVYDVRFVGGIPYPYHPATGYIWRVNWFHWEEYHRLVCTLPAGAGGLLE